MQKMARTVLPFKLAATEESMTAQSGLVLLGEFAQGAGLHRWLEREMPKPGSGHAYAANKQALPLILVLNHTLDIDATQIVAETRDAVITPAHDSLFPRLDRVENGCRNPIP